MRIFRHWTPRYIKNRLGEMYYQKTHQHLPWLTKTANVILGSYLQKTDVGLEFGSGRSTAWLASQCKHLSSVEHHEAWYNKVDEMLKNSNTDNVKYHFIPREASDGDGEEAEYVKIIDTFEANSIDFALIDGIYRDHCVLRVIDKIRPGGVVIIDNVNRYLPCESYSPASRTHAQGPNGEAWERAYQTLSTWRTIWTTSGVTDTAFFFKPWE